MQNTKEIIAAIQKGDYDERLKDIYVDPKLLPYQRNRYVKALEKFEELYGEKQVEIYSAPGRSEVGGNHTDHQRGNVFACALNVDVIAVAAKTEDNVIRIVSDDYNIKDISLLDLAVREDEINSSEALIRGVAKRLADEGYKTGGFCAYMTSDVLRGSGMSSSAAFEVVLGDIFSGIYNDMKISDVFIAQASQYAENVYFGKPCGLMDQMSSSVGSLVNIDFKDPAVPVINKVEIDFSKYGHILCIVDTKGSHADLTPEYAAIPPEMKAVAAFFGKEVLREVDEAEFYEKIPEIRKKTGDRAIVRAIHFFDDNRYAVAEADALKKGDFEEFIRNVRLSGDSSYKFLQNVYPVCDIQSQGTSIALALSKKVLKDRGAARIHGGGFAGTIQAFVPTDLVDEYKAEMDRVFGEGSCQMLQVRKYGGIRVL